MSADQVTSTIQGLIYDQLVSYDAQGKLVPQLADTIDASTDATTYVFSLRRGVHFHDGTELTAADVKRSLERALHRDTPCPLAAFYSRIAGFEAYRAGRTPELSGIRLNGRYSLSFGLSEPDPTFLHALALPLAAPICPRAGRVYSRGPEAQPCGTGPFRLAVFEQGQYVRVQRHAGYWQTGKPYLDAIEWQLAMSQSTQRFKFERGDLDYMRDFSDVDSMLFRSSPAWRNLGGWQSPLTTFGVFMNTELPPFDNRHLRRAVAFALNHGEIALLRPGHIRVHNRLVPEAILPSRPGMELQRHALSEALHEMELAGHAYDPVTGRGGYPEPIRYLALIDSFGQSAAEVYAQQLARIGIRLKIEVAGWPAFLAKAGRRHTTLMGTAGWAADFPDASSFFEPLFSSSSIHEEESQNSAFFSNQALDDLLARSRRTRDPSERQQLFQRAEELIAQEAPWALGYSTRYFELWHPYVHGYTPHPILNQHIRDIWLDSAARPAMTNLLGAGASGEALTGLRR